MTEVENPKPARPRFSATVKITRVELMVLEQALEALCNRSNLSKVESALVADTKDHLAKVWKQFT